MKILKILFFVSIVIAGCSNFDRFKVVHGTQAQSQPKYDLQRTPEYKVLAVSDGDTIAVSMDGKRVNIRSACIDAPETGHGAKRPGQPLGDTAKQKYKELIDKSGGKVRLKVTDSDRYGRKVAEVIFSDNATAQEHLALAGLAWPYERYKANCPSWDAVKAAGEEAKRDRLGIYASGTNLPPWEWRKTKWR